MTAIESPGSRWPKTEGDGCKHFISSLCSISHSETQVQTKATICMFAKVSAACIVLSLLNSCAQCYILSVVFYWGRRLLYSEVQCAPWISFKGHFERRLLDIQTTHWQMSQKHISTTDFCHFVRFNHSVTFLSLLETGSLGLLFFGQSLTHTTGHFSCFMLTGRFVFVWRVFLFHDAKTSSHFRL